MTQLCRAGWCFALLLPLAAGCATAPRGPTLPVPRLAHARADDPALARLLADFYGAGLAPDRALADAEAVLRRHPGEARAHEVAAFAALLQGDHERAFQHFLGAAADLDADAPEVALWHLSDEPTSQAAAIAALCEALRAQHPRAAVRALATFRLAQLRLDAGRLGEARRLASSIGAIEAWQVLGAFDNDQGKGFFSELPAEAAPAQAIPSARTVAGPLVPLRWRRVERLTPLASVHLDDLLWPQQFAAAYLVTWLRSETARTASLRISTGSPTRAFVNDVEVVSDEHVAGGELDNLVATVTLHAGWNQLLIKSAHRHGPWYVRARFTDADGAALPGLGASATPQAYTRDDAVAPELAAPPTPSGPEGRRQLLEAQRQLRGGHHHEALAAVRPFVDAQPSNLLALYHGALAYWDNEEGGRAIDLLDRGVEQAHGGAAAFLVRRAQYYAQKQLWEKAQVDLLGAAAGDARRAAQVQLAELFQRRGWQTDRCTLLARMLALRPDDGWARREHGECLDALGYTEAAEREYARVVADQADLGAWSHRIQLAARRGRLRQALGWLRQVAPLDPTEPAWPQLEGDLLRRLGDADAARARYEAAIALAPERPAAWARLGELAYERGDRAAAIAAWGRAHELDPNDSALAQHIEFLEPPRLGFIEKLVPDAAEIERALRTTVHPAPNAQLVLLLDQEVTEVNADGSARRVVTEVARAVDDKGRDLMTSVQVPHGSIKVLAAYALTDKGERQEASSIRNGEIRFRNLQPGSKTVLQYIHYAPAPHFLPGVFFASWMFQSPARQHERSTWVVVLPEKKPLHLEVVGPVQHERRDEGGRQIHVFSAAHLPPIAQEPHMAPVIDLAAHVDISTADSWEDYVRWERGLLTEAFHGNPALDALVDRLVAGATSPRDKLERLFHHVAQEIRYQQDYETTIAGVRPHRAPSVIERGYGDCKDKAVLLIEMARRVGIKLSFAILRTTPHGRISRDVPNQQFNHAIVYVPAQPGFAEPLFLDPTSDGLDVGNLRIDDQGALALVLDPTSGKWEFAPIPYQTAELQYDHHKVHIDVRSPTEAVATDEISLRGITAMGLRHVLRNEGQSKVVFDAVAASLFPGATLRSSKSGSKEDILHPLTISLEVDASQSLRAEDERFRLSLPARIAITGTIALKTRETPLRFGPPDSSSYDIDAELPDGYEVVHAPADFTVQQACFSLTRKAQVVGRKLSVQLSYQRRCSEISPAEYAGYRASVQQAIRKLDDDLLFARAVEGRKPPRARKGGSP